MSITRVHSSTPCSLFGQEMSLGLWNVRDILQTNELYVVGREHIRKYIAICGSSEMHWILVQNNTP